MVKSQAVRMLPAIPQRTAEKRWTAPAPEATLAEILADEHELKGALWVEPVELDLSQTEPGSPPHPPTPGLKGLGKVSSSECSLEIARCRP